MNYPKNFICATQERGDLYHQMPAPYFRRDFMLAELPEKAEMLICGLGFYRLYINGTEITRGLLSPYIVNSDCNLMYDNYDLLPYLQTGKNLITVLLGNGMQNAIGGYVWDLEKAAFRSSPKFALELLMTNKNGEETSIISDGHFRTAPSPILFDDLRMGERYDATKENGDPTSLDYDDSSWRFAIGAELPRGIPTLCTTPPIVVEKTLHPVKIWEEDGGYIYDFGENNAGLTELCIEGTVGQKVILTHGEWIRDGKFTVDNIRFVRPEYADIPLYAQITEYTCHGKGVEKHIPSFTYYGCQYVRVTGITKEQATTDLLKFHIMHSDLKPIGDFACSDERLNRLLDMTRRSTLANFYHMPTDCPHREKLGWTGDANISAEHTLLYYKADLAYQEWLKTITTAMTTDGVLPGIIPTGGWGIAWGNGPSWDRIIVIIPYLLWKLRGNLEAAKFCEHEMLRHVYHLASTRDENGLLGYGLGDWCSPSPDPLNPKAPLHLTDTITGLDSIRRAGELFRALGRTETADYCVNLAENMRQAVLTYLYDKETGVLKGECQSSQAMALFYNIVEEEDKAKVFANLVKYIHAEDDHIDTGIFGAETIFTVLAEYGEVDLALHMITRPDAPSYGWMLERGMTTLHEGIVMKEIPESFNHHFYGHITGFFMKYLAGIRQNPKMEGDNTFIISPCFASTLEHAKASLETNYGTLSSSWTKNDDTITLDVVIPENMTGSVVAPCGYTLDRCGKSAKTGQYTLTKNA